MRTPMRDDIDESMTTTESKRTNAGVLDDLKNCVDLTTNRTIRVRLLLRYYPRGSPSLVSAESARGTSLAKLQRLHGAKYVVLFHLTTPLHHPSPPGKADRPTGGQAPWRVLGTHALTMQLPSSTEALSHYRQPGASLARPRTLHARRLWGRSVERGRCR